MDLAEIRKLLEKKLEQRLEEEGVEGLPPRYEFGEHGAELFAKIKKVMQNPWSPDRKLFIVENLDDGNEYRLPSHRVLENELINQGAQEGDLVLIKLIRTYERETGDGQTRTVNVYRAAVYRPEDSDGTMEQYVNELFKLYNGKIPMDQFKYFIEEVRGWKAEEVIEKLGLKVEEGVVTR